jgi:hypothetical protein
LPRFPFVCPEPVFANDPLSAAEKLKEEAAFSGVFAGKVAARFKERVRAYEIWNEPTYTMGDEVYSSLLKAAYPQIKAADPLASVVAMAVRNHELLLKNDQN